MEQRSSRKMAVVIKSVMGIVLCVLFAFLLLCNLIIIAKGIINPEKPPSILGITPMVVLSGSMSGDAKDHIEAGDLIFVEKEEPENLKVGDIIAYMSEGTTVTHRITAINMTGDRRYLFTTKGDANNAEDIKDVTEDQVVGVYQSRIPKLGNLTLFLQQPLGILLFVGIPLILFIIYDSLRRQRYASYEKAKTEEMEAELTRLRSLTGERNSSTVKSGTFLE